MACEFINIGQHKNVYAVVFGDNDVLITSSTHKVEGRACILFHTANPDLKPDQYKHTNQMPFPEMCLMFEDAHTIASMIQMLAEIQKMFL